MTADEVLRSLVEAEHAAVYGYGVLGARLDSTSRRVAQLAYDSHRTRRDQLSRLLRDRGATPPLPLPAYDVTVQARADALALAVRLEDGLAVRWRLLVTVTANETLRRLGVVGLQETAVRAAQWRRTAGVTPVTVALPGTP